MGIHNEVDNIILKELKIGRDREKRGFDSDTSTYFRSSWWWFSARKSRGHVCHWFYQGDNYSPAYLIDDRYWIIAVTSSLLPRSISSDSLDMCPVYICLTREVAGLLRSSVELFYTHPVCHIRRQHYQERIQGLYCASLNSMYRFVPAINMSRDLGTQLQRHDMETAAHFRPQPQRKQQSPRDAHRYPAASVALCPLKSFTYTQHS